MKRYDILRRLGYTVPESKKKRVIVHTDLAAEADDHFALVHHLLTPTENVTGIIAANFERRFRNNPSLSAMRFTSMEKSYEETKKLLKLMDIDDVPFFRGAPDRIDNRHDLPISEGSRFIVREAMRDCDEPLYIALQGTLTDLAVAYLTKPEIADRITAAIWIGGGAYPNGGSESNLEQDIYAAQVLFSSPMPIWQIPLNVYVGMNISFAELTARVKPCGQVGHYLAENMLAVNDWYGNAPRHMDFTHGEVWTIGDQPTVSALLEPLRSQQRHIIRAPRIMDDMLYEDDPNGKEIIVYHEIDRRLTMEDFFIKLKLCYGEVS